MVALKRVTVWLLERLVEACMLGALFTVLIVRNSDIALRSGYGNLLAEVWTFSVVLAVLLFMHGYYFTTAVFGVLWRSTKPWVYPAITVALFALHMHIIFLRGKQDFTLEAMAMELPMLVGGALIVFVCSFSGNQALKSWTGARPTLNPYLSASALTLFAFLLLNIANYLRPVVGSFSFRPYGLPFTFYREGGYVREWVWHGGVFLWRGLFADVAIVVVIIAVAGRAAQRLCIDRRFGE